MTTTTSVCKRLLAQILAFSMMLSSPYLRLIFWKLLLHAYLSIASHVLSRAGQDRICTT